MGVPAPAGPRAAAGRPANSVSATAAVCRHNHALVELLWVGRRGQARGRRGQARRRGQAFV